MRAAFIVLFGLVYSVPAQALEIVRTSTTTLPFRAEIGAEVYLRFRASKIPGGDWGKRLSLQRARLELKAELGDHIRAVLEPDFAGQDADLADAYLEIEPIEDQQLVGGQFKAPFGIMEVTGRWSLPSLTRGLISEIVSDRLGFGGRRIGAMIDLRAKGLFLKPQLEVGAFGDFAGSRSGDAAARLTLKLTKGADLQLAWYVAARAAIENHHGNAGALTLLYDRGPWFATVELLAGHARLLRSNGSNSEENATFLGARSLVGYAIELDDQLELEPFLGLEIFDPNTRTFDDRGIDVRGGASLFWLKMFRLGVELDVQQGELAFVVPDLITLTFLAGVALE